MFPLVFAYTSLSELLMLPAPHHLADRAAPGTAHMAAPGTVAVAQSPWHCVGLSLAFNSFAPRALLARAPRALLARVRVFATLSSFSPHQQQAEITTGSLNPLKAL